MSFGEELYQRSINANISRFNVWIDCIKDELMNTAGAGPMTYKRDIRIYCDPKSANDLFDSFERQLREKYADIKIIISRNYDIILYDDGNKITKGNVMNVTFLWDKDSLAEVLAIAK